MRPANTNEIVRVLYHAATGKEPTEGEEWTKFCDTAVRCLAEVRRGAISEAHAAVYSYQPIDPQDMQAAYRRGYEATKVAIGGLILDLNREPRP